MKMWTRAALGILAFALSALVTVPFAATAADARNSAILAQIAKIRTEKSLGSRIMMAHELSYMVQEKDPNTIRNDEIIGLTRLMDDRDDGVRMWAANCLGYIGPRAKSAAPALRRAYLKIRCTTVEVSSRPGIEAALANIGATLSPGDKCRRF